MFSPALEAVLHIAMREAISRRHAYLTVEHLLYALAHDQDGERILGACDVDLPALRRALDAYLNESVEQLKRGSREPEQTLAFRRVLQAAILHVQSAQRDEAESGDILAAILQQPKSYATQLLTDQGVTRLDVLNYVSHGITKSPSPAQPAPAGAADEGRWPPLVGDPLRAYTSTSRSGPGGKARSAVDVPTSCSVPSRCSAGGGRTIRFSSAIPALARRRSPKGWPRVC